MRVPALAVLVMSLLAGCSGPKFQATNPAPRPLTAKAPAEVETRTEMPDGDAHIEIGVWEFETQSVFKAIGRTRDDAAARGCDILVVTDTGPSPGVSGYRRYLMRCLVKR